MIRTSQSSFQSNEQQQFVELSSLSHSTDALRIHVMLLDDLDFSPSNSRRREKDLFSLFIARTKESAFFFPLIAHVRLEILLYLSSSSGSKKVVVALTDKRDALLGLRLRRALRADTFESFRRVNRQSSRIGLRMFLPSVSLSTNRRGKSQFREQGHTSTSPFVRRNTFTSVCLVLDSLAHRRLCCSPSAK